MNSATLLGPELKTDKIMMRKILLFVAFAMAGTSAANARDISVEQALKPLPCDEVRYGEKANAAMQSSWLKVPYSGRLTNAENGRIVCTVEHNRATGQGTVVVEEHFTLGQSPAIIRHGIRRLELLLPAGEKPDGTPKLTERLMCYSRNRDFICEGTPTHVPTFTLQSAWRDGNLLGVVFAAGIYQSTSGLNAFEGADPGTSMAILTKGSSLPLLRLAGGYETIIYSARYESKPEKTIEFLNTVISGAKEAPVEVHFMKVIDGESKLQALKTSPVQINTIWSLTKSFVGRLTKPQ